MRGERDRFVALAFCWADLLLELDSNETVVFAAGATQPLLGRPAEDLVGLAFPELIVERDRPLVQALLGIARKRGRIENVTVRLQGTRGVTPSSPLPATAWRTWKGTTSWPSGWARRGARKAPAVT